MGSTCPKGKGRFCVPIGLNDQRTIHHWKCLFIGLKKKYSGLRSKLGIARNLQKCDSGFDVLLSQAASFAATNFIYSTVVCRHTMTNPMARNKSCGLLEALLVETQILVTLKCRNTSTKLHLKPDMRNGVR